MDMPEFMRTGMLLLGAAGASGYGISTYDEAQHEERILEMRQQEREAMREENRLEEIELREFVFKHCAQWRDTGSIEDKLKGQRALDGQ